MDPNFLLGLSGLGQPRLRSIYDETGTPDSGYATEGPYHCEDCIHKTAMDEPFCVHPKVIGDERLQNKLVYLDGRPVVKIDMERGCCRYVNQTRPESDEDKNHGKSADE
jgi:hypothetical protein